MQIKKTAVLLEEVRRLFVGGVPVTQIGHRLGLHGSTIRSWIRQAEKAGSGWARAKEIRKYTLAVGMHDALDSAKDELLDALRSGIPGAAATMRRVCELQQQIRSTMEPRHQAAALKRAWVFAQAMLDGEKQMVFRGVLDRYIREHLSHVTAEWLRDTIFSEETQGESSTT